MSFSLMEASIIFVWTRILDLKLHKSSFHYKNCFMHLHHFHFQFKE